MQLLGIYRLDEFVQSHELARIPLAAWQLEAEDAQWSGPEEVQSRYLDADVRPDRVVFCFKDRFKLDVKTKYQRGVLVIEKVWSVAVAKQLRSTKRSALRSKA